MTWEVRGVGQLDGGLVPEKGQPWWGRTGVLWQCLGKMLWAECASAQWEHWLFFGSDAPPGRDGEAWLFAEAGKGQQEPSGPGWEGERSCLQSGGG